MNPFRVIWGWLNFFCGMIAMTAMVVLVLDHYNGHPELFHWIIWVILVLNTSATTVSIWLGYFPPDS
jgi:hypothetical protein